MTTQMTSDDTRVNKNTQIQQISVYKCMIGAANPRAGSRLGDDDVTDLAASMANPAIGLLHPIIVTLNDDTTFNVIAGRRRLEAAKQLGWETIAAVVIDKAEHDLGGLATIENLHRRAMTPFEEAYAAATNVDRLADSGTSREQAIAITAATFGRSATWVRDRLYLLNLAAELREQVKIGKIPIEHARRLAALTDHKAQKEAWKECSYYDGICPVEDVESAVKRRQRDASLAGVAWQLEAERIAGRIACVRCPSNTNNDPHLFEGFAGSPATETSQRRNPLLGINQVVSGPFCMNSECFRAKQSATEKLIQATVSRSATQAFKAEKVQAGKGKVPAKTVQAVIQAATEEATVKLASQIRPEVMEEKVRQEVVNKLAPAEAVKKERSAAQIEEEERDQWKERDRKAKQRAKEQREHDQQICSHLKQHSGFMLTIFVLEHLSYSARKQILGRLGEHAAAIKDKAAVPDQLRLLLSKASSGKIGLADLEGLIVHDMTPEYGLSFYRKLRASLGKPGKMFLDSLCDPNFVPTPEQASKPKATRKAKGKRKGRP